VCTLVHMAALDPPFLFGAVGHAACHVPSQRPRVPGRGRCLEVRLSRPLDVGSGSKADESGTGSVLWSAALSADACGQLGCAVRSMPCR
jgi:hypothetical protein